MRTRQLSRQERRVIRKYRQRREERWRQAEANVAKEIKPEIKDLLHRYALILPPFVTSMTEAEQRARDAAQPGSQPRDRLLVLLMLAGAHIREGRPLDATHILDDAARLQRGHKDLVPMEPLLLHLQLKAKAAQGLLPATRDLMMGNVNTLFHDTDINTLAGTLCHCHLMSIRAPRAALVHGEWALRVAPSVYRLLDDPQDRETHDAINDVEIRTYALMMKGLLEGANLDEDEDALDITHPLPRVNLAPPGVVLTSPG